MTTNKLWKLIGKDEVVTVKDLYYRAYHRNGTILSYELFLNLNVRLCDRLEVINYTKRSPYLIKRKLSFFEKTIDKVKNLWYNKYVR
jgi:hypothetical protein